MYERIDDVCCKRAGTGRWQLTVGKRVHGYCAGDGCKRLLSKGPSPFKNVSCEGFLPVLHKRPSELYTSFVRLLFHLWSVYTHGCECMYAYASFGWHLYICICLVSFSTIRQIHTNFMIYFFLFCEKTITFKVRVFNRIGFVE